MQRNKSLHTLGVAILTISMGILAPAVWGQSNYKTLHRFTGGADGNTPWGRLISDGAGNLYGTSFSGGIHAFGNVFKLTPRANGTWMETVLYSFCNCLDGRYPVAGLVFDESGNLYGTTAAGGVGDGGAVFKLTLHTGGTWAESLLYSFCSLTDCADGRGAGAVTLETAGNLYGTTSLGGGSAACPDGCGVVYKLTQNSDGTWTETVLHSFTGGADGGVPQGGVILDDAGNLYGSTLGYGSNAGTVFKIAPNGTEEVILRFSGSNGAMPFGTLTFDSVGNLYGTTEAGGNLSLCIVAGHPGCGVVFELSPIAGGGWKETILHRFVPAGGSVPSGQLIFDQAGNLYGTASEGGDRKVCSPYGCGVIYKLAPNLSGGWKETVLHYFGNLPGAVSAAGLISDSGGNLYGTTLGDQSTTFGSVFEITP
jgi:uncharacterized repeat protein (TIGR03803 family)